MYRYYILFCKIELKLLVQVEEYMLLNSTATNPVLVGSSVHNV